MTPITEPALPLSLTEFRNERRKRQEKCGDFSLLLPALCRDTARGAKEKNHRKFLGLRVA
jgi:hypothetical protein